MNAVYLRCALNPNSLYANLVSMTRTAPAIVATLATLLAAPLLHAQTFTDPANLRGEHVAPRTGRELPIDGGQGNAALGLRQMLRRLNTRASLMLIVAHPDDEDGGMLTFYSRGLGARVAVLTLNRGEGGQNAMTGDFEDALGLLRTQELLSADRYSGVEQMFGTEVDFGFSKTKAEAFAKWGHDRVLYDAVRAVRLFRPLVIASVWSGSVTDGHGQHQVSGEIAQEVFTAAADPNVFPELTKEGILPWAPLKVYARVPMQAISDKGLFDYATGQYVPAEFTNYVTHTTTHTPPKPDVIVHEGDSDPLLTAAAANRADLPNPSLDPATPLSYVQFARVGLGLQRSQVGPGVRNAPAGKFDVAYHRYGSRLSFQPTSEVNFFDAIDAHFHGMIALAPALPDAQREAITELGARLAKTEEVFDKLPSPQLITGDLAAELQSLDHIVEAVDDASLPAIQRADLLHELRIKRVQLNDALALALGLELDATVHGNQQVAGSEVVAWTTLRTTSDAPISVVRERIRNGDGNNEHATGLTSERKELTAAHPLERTIRVGTKFTGDVTRPYFSRDDIEQAVYKLRDPALRNAAMTPPALTAWARIDFRGVPVDVGRVLHDGPQPVSLVPRVSVALAPHAQVLASTQDGVGGTLMTSGEPIVSESLGEPKEWKLEPVSTAANCIGCDPFWIRVPKAGRAAATLHANVKTKDGMAFTEGFRAIGYGDLPRTNYYVPATDHIVPAELRLPPHLRVGYVPGTGDAVPEALTSLGIPVQMLSVADLTPAKLAQFDTIILGVRTYNAHPDLHGAPTQALFDFARNGGNVVVQYQTMEFRAADAPFPLELGANEKVVDETAPVHLLDEQNPLLSAPNRISPADFNGWIEERGHGFLSTWDAHYTALTETHDPGEPAEHVLPQAPQRGGLITTPLGKGRWTYVAFAIYRQLPEAVPGAFRLFVNLITPPAAH
jgi:LmbE family N-acetylglucosaminyl deacetylase